ncbi:MAG: hypothetical protein A2Z83_05815, partial [Omnitrophica bacterium GWA2_52_8]
MQLLPGQAGVYRWPVFSSKVQAACSGREYPQSRYSDFLDAAGFHGNVFVQVKQVHGSRILTVTSASLPAPETEADGLFTAEAGIVLGIRTADCLPLFFEAAAGVPVIGVVHAGWRGLDAGIIEEAVIMLERDFAVAPSQVRVAIGPAIRGCCYEVGPEFEAFFPLTYCCKKTDNSRGTVDLAREAASILKREGVPETAVFDSGICTSCHSDQFFSYRVERSTPERILSVVMLSKAV